MIHAALSTILPRSHSFASPPPSFLPPPAQRSESLFPSSSSSFSDGGKKRKRKKETGKVNSVSAWSAQGKGDRTRKESSIRTTRCEIVLVVCVREKKVCGVTRRRNRISRHTFTLFKPASGSEACLSSLLLRRRKKKENIRLLRGGEPVVSSRHRRGENFFVPISFFVLGK